jgi:hypothetical protein
VTPVGEGSATAGTSAPPGASGARAASGPATAPAPNTAVALRAVALGVLYAALVLALLWGGGGWGFIYQGF